MGLVAGLGIVSRLFQIGLILWDKYLGLSLIWPKGTIAAKTMITGVYVLAIETFQLTPIPAQLNRSHNLAVWLFAYTVLGSGFSAWDLLAYGIGLAGVVAVDRLYGRSDLSHPPADPSQPGEERPLC